MMVLFPDLALYLLPGDKSPLQAINFMNQWCHDKKIKKTEVQVYYNFFELAACAKTAGGDSVIAHKCTTVPRPSKKMQKWMMLRLTCTLGASKGTVTNKS